jgi:predicted nucleotide-binding protein (sugar kinase/HSP70/actin superfamily)
MFNYKKKIGIPRALLYYKYGDLWENFFYELNYEVVVSPMTTSDILEMGKKNSIDESCLALKVFMGHVHYLVNKTDYILIPRIATLKRREKTCTNFSALYDIVNNTFNINIIDYNIDVEKGLKEKKAFILMGKQLMLKTKDVKRAYYKAKRIMARNVEHQKIKQYLVLNDRTNFKILLVSHPYNTYDNLIGQKVKAILETENIDIIYADIYDEKLMKNCYRHISEQLYWTYSKELLSAVNYYEEKVNGIIVLSVFPCGLDSLTNEMCVRKANKPIIVIIIDELLGEAGLQTRIESFIDIIRKERGGLLSECKNNKFS